MRLCLLPCPPKPLVKVDAALRETNHAYDNLVFQQVSYTVIGSAYLKGYDVQKIDCWLLHHESKGNKEVFWISKKTREVLKLEQEVNGTLQRFKIKLGFSN